MEGVILDLDSLGPGLSMDSLFSQLDDWRVFSNTSPEQCLGRIRSCDIVISNKVPLDAATLEQCPQLKLICVAATGTNNVDLEAAQRLRIKVCNVRAYGTATVAQHTWSLILQLATQQQRYYREVLNGVWSHSSQFCLHHHSIMELTGKRLAIIGYGELGRAVARIAEAFGMETLIAAKNYTVKTDSASNRSENNSGEPPRIPLNDLLTLADVVSLHCPLTPNNYHMINREALALMKPSALLINCARGGLVDELALKDALQNKQIAGAALDVLEQEPPPEDHPLIQGDIPNIIVTPHNAWASLEARQRLVDQLKDNIEAFLAGEARNLV